jgi:hypothetical protein
MLRYNESWTSCFSADGNYEVRYKSNVLIYPNGEVLWVPPAIYQVNIYSHNEVTRTTASDTKTY